MEAKRERIELASGERRWWRATGVGGVGGRLTEPRSGRCAASLFTCWFNNNFISCVLTALVGATVFFFSYFGFLRIPEVAVVRFVSRKDSSSYLN